MAEVRAAINNGDRFYTVSPSTGHTAAVLPYDVWVGYQRVETTRSSADAIWDNNLDNIRTCSWRRS